MGSSFDLLPPAERARHYREMAEAAFKLADNAASPEIRATYRALASDWHRLAAGIELEVDAAAPGVLIFQSLLRPRRVAEPD